MPDPYVDAMARGFEDELRKIAGAPPAKGGILSTLMRKEVALPLAGIAAYKVLSRAESDRRMGRQMRIQSTRGY
jgi:hypothetical protein